MDNSHLKKAQMKAILVLDPDSQYPFETFISDLHLSSEEKLSEAKSMLKLIKDKDPQSLAIKLSNGLSHYTHHLYFRARCAKILGELLTDVDEYKDLFGVSVSTQTWHTRLSVSTQSAIKRILLDRIKFEQESNFIIQELRGTVCRLAISLLPDNNWPELLPFLFQCLCDSTSKDYLKLSVLWIFVSLAFNIGETMVPCVKPLHSLFLTTLNDYTLDLHLRVDVTVALINFNLYVPASSHEKLQFQKLLPCMMRTLTNALSNCDKAKFVLDHFITLAKEDPKFFRGHLRDVVSSMLDIGEDNKLETKTRHLALEFVMTLVEAREKAPGMMKKLPLFTHTCFALLLNLLLDIKLDEPSWHSADDFDNVGDTDNHNFGLVCLSRFANALGGKTITPVAMEQLGDYLAAPEWEKRHAALDALCQIAEGSSKVMIKYLQRLVDMVLPFFHHPHPRVKWAAIRAIGQLSVAFCPVFQERYHNRVLPALAEAMDDSKNPRIQV